jgi:hypothetical protein
MLFAPLEGWRHVEVTDRHAALDYAQVLKALSDRHFLDASKIVLVQDNLSTHKPASLYEAFPAAEARRLVERFEWHYTPKHGSWLDMAETELSVLLAVSMNIGPLVLTNFGPPSGVLRHRVAVPVHRVGVAYACPPVLPALRWAAVRRNR